MKYWYTEVYQYDDLWTLGLSSCIWVGKQACHQPWIPSLYFYWFPCFCGETLIGRITSRSLEVLEGTVLQWQKMPSGRCIVLSWCLGQPSGKGQEGCYTAVADSKGRYVLLPSGDLVLWVRSSWMVIQLSKIFFCSSSVSSDSAPQYSSLSCAQCWLCLRLAVPAGSAVLFSVSVPWLGARAAFSEPYSSISQSLARWGHPHLWSVCFVILRFSRPCPLAASSCVASSRTTCSFRMPASICSRYPLLCPLGFHCIALLLLTL